MAIPAPPFVECDQVHAVLAVKDIPAAIDFYTKKLGFKLGFTWGGDPPTFAGVNIGKVQVFLQKGTPSPQGCGVTFLVGDADQLYAFHRANGVEVTAEIADREYGIRDYGVRDLNGYHLSFGHHLFNAGPPIKIERVDVPVRLEKRLSALLQDLRNGRGEPLPFAQFLFQLVASGAGKRIEPGPAIIVRSAPLGADPAALLQAMQRRVERPLANL